MWTGQGRVKALKTPPPKHLSCCTFCPNLFRLIDKSYSKLHWSNMWNPWGWKGCSVNFLFGSNLQFPQRFSCLLDNIAPVTSIKLRLTFFFFVLLLLTDPFLGMIFRLKQILMGVRLWEVDCCLFDQSAVWSNFPDWQDLSKRNNVFITCIMSIPKTYLDIHTLASKLLNRGLITSLYLWILPISLLFLGAGSNYQFPKVK